MTKDKQSPLRWFFSLSGSGVFVALLVFIALVSIAAPRVTGGQFFTWSNIIQVFRQQTYIGIIACGMTLVIITGNIDLSVGSQLTLMTVLCAQFSNAWGFGNWALPLTLLVGVTCGLTNGLLVSGLKLNSFITTLGTSSIFGALALILVSGHTLRAKTALFDVIGTGMVLGLIPVPVVILLAVVAVFAFLAGRTVFGQRLYAIGANPVAARFTGIKSRREVAITYVLNGICCAIAAIVLLARSESANPQIGGSKEMDVILAVVLGGTSILGGKGSVWGTVIGFLFIGFMSSGFSFLAFSQYTQWVIMGVILLVALAADLYSEKRGGV
ncbi:MAG: ABC transporter permease [Lachnospiraceae bacterium]|jgi:ribose transport system permease protein|nr:ABC transporter permease [Lachnospiraceae bacterium]